MNPIQPQNGKTATKMKRPLQVMKFGGTSVGDASCIGKAAEIVRAAANENSIVVVVSAMSGVTNRLIEAANQSRAGNEEALAEIFERLVEQHDDVITALIQSHAERVCLQGQLRDLFAEGKRLCQGTVLLRELTPRALDSISGLGERLCAPIVAAALSEIGVDSKAIDATELVVTDSHHGAAEPKIELIRTRCQAGITPLLRKNVVPVVTGFIGTSEDGVLTTLGRGGSDYSATLLGAALDADEVIIWSDVSGLLTADPRLVAEACTIREISYREAAELAYFGAKVLHPKTLRPVMQRGIPVWVKNTFAPNEPGTKITAGGPVHSGEVRALAAIRDAALITVTGRSTQDCGEGDPSVLARTVAAMAAVRADVLLISQSSSNGDICLVIPSALAKRTIEALRREFSKEKVEHTVSDSAVSVVTLVGHNMRAASGAAVHAFAALDGEEINVIATAQGSSDCSMSFVVPRQDMKVALTSIHREFELGSLSSRKRPVRSVGSPSRSLKYESEQAVAD